MQPDLYRLLLKSISEANILPVTSACNGRCVFCSHLQNPPGIRVYSLPPLGKEEILELAEFLDPEKRIIIGESVTRINEGEPFLHPEFPALLTGLRRRFPATPIQITTNGMGLTPATVALLARLGRVRLVVSLNSATAGGRRILMGDNNPAAVLRAVASLRERGIPFDGSIVALPHLVGWEDLRQTIAFLVRWGAATVRIFLPGYTRYTRQEWVPPAGTEEKLQALLAEEREKTRVPLILEPPSLKDLTPRILGVIEDSPAARAGLKGGDVITAVNGKRPFSRVDAFRQVQAAGKVVIDIIRDGKPLRFCLEKEEDASPGLVMAADLDPDLFRSFTGRVRQLARGRALLATSTLAAPILASALERVKEELPSLEIMAVPNQTFGGNICCSGLLLLEDFLAVLPDRVRDRRPECIFLPGLAFADQGRDLRGRSYLELQAVLKTPVELIQ
ncbi:MAG TPA: DUF512 domain-containing protein [Firmicutes bacterium]|nr:DUF512 domain-containing protein [Bacillota bacterium]